MDAGEHARPILSARGLTKSYTTGSSTQTVLDGVDLDVPSGQFLSIMGPSGSGKSTLLHLLGGLDTPDAGEVLLDGDPLSSKSDDDRTRVRRADVGIVYQFFNLIPVLTAAENIALPAVIAGRSESSYQRKLDEVLDLVDLGEHRDKQPSELSGGQQQRAAIARGLFIEPVVLLADEPTGNLDLRSGAEVLDLFLTAQRELGQTIVMVTHDPRGAAFGDEVVLLRDGAVHARLDIHKKSRGGARHDRAHPNRARDVLRWLEGLDATGSVRSRAAGPG